MGTTTPLVEALTDVSLLCDILEFKGEITADTLLLAGSRDPLPAKQALESKLQYVTNKRVSHV